MNSKEALDEIIRSLNETTTGINGLGEVVVDNCLIRSNKAELEIIQKDLERLEILEQENEELKEKIRLTHTEFGFNNLSDFRKQMRENYIELVKLKKAIDIIKQCSPNLVEEKSQLKDDLFTRHLFEYKENPASSNYVLAFMYDSFISKEEYELLKEVLCNENNTNNV